MPKIKDQNWNDKGSANRVDRLVQSMLKCRERERKERKRKRKKDSCHISPLNVGACKIMTNKKHGGRQKQWHLRTFLSFLTSITITSPPPYHHHTITPESNTPERAKKSARETKKESKTKKKERT
jgi:hypothetical protein